MDTQTQMHKIDIHAHAVAFPEYYPPHYNGGRWVSADELIGFYDRLGIEKGVLQPISSPEGMSSPMTSEACKWLADRFSDRFLWFCNVDPRAGLNTSSLDLEKLIVFYKSLGAKGVGEITANIYADDPKVDYLFACCAELEMPVLIHIATNFTRYGLVDELGLPRLEKMLKAHPKLKLLGHSQPFWSEISADNTEATRSRYPEGKVREGRLARLMRDYENLYCDLSAGSGANAMMRDPDYAVAFIDEFSDRLLYGCDICLTTTSHPFPFRDFLDQLLESGLVSIENYRKICRSNAERILKL